jgi:hypothetical protein
LLLHLRQTPNWQGRKYEASTCGRPLRGGIYIDDVAEGLILRSAGVHLARSSRKPLGEAFDERLGPARSDPIWL